MKLSTVMVVIAVVALIFGLSFVFMPAQSLELYGITLDIPGQYLARYLGAAFLGFAVMNWFGRNAPASGARRAIVLADFVSTAVGFVVAIFDVIYGTGNALVWSTVIIYLVFALGSGYFVFLKPGTP